MSSFCKICWTAPANDVIIKNKIDKRNYTTMFLIIVNQIVKMLLLLLLGIFCYRKKLIDQTGSKMLANLLLMIVNPCSLYYRSGRLQPTAGPWTSAFLSGRISDAHCRLQFSPPP